MSRINNINIVLVEPLYAGNLGSVARAMERQQAEQRGGPYLVYATVGPTDPVDVREVCRAICELGGVETDGGYAFPTLESRRVALELLGEKYGDRYVSTTPPF